MTESKKELEEIYQLSMQIITHAGDARNSVMKALKACETENYDEASTLLSDAKERITLAHKIQTETIQKESRGETITFSLLFSHAQDTLMTVKSEFNLATQLTNIFKRIDQKINEKDDS